MNKNSIKINNPLTVIALFSMLTEASAAVSLPYINSEHQKIYVWFLIVFPSLLITLFFLTLNFNNKTLYTPADLSKAEALPTHSAYTLQPCAKQIPTFNNISLPAKPLAPQYLSALNLSSYTHQDFIPPPDTYRIYDPDPVKPANPNNASATDPAQKHILIESTELNTLRFIDLNHPNIQRTQKLTPKDLLNKYYKSTRKQKDSNSRNDVLFVLANRKSETLLAALTHSLLDNKNLSLTSPTTLITYNTDTHKLDISKLLKGTTTS